MQDDYNFISMCVLLMMLTVEMHFSLNVQVQVQVQLQLQAILLVKVDPPKKTFLELVHCAV